jgi:hypothetical protein
LIAAYAYSTRAGGLFGMQFIYFSPFVNPFAWRQPLGQ